MLIFSSNRLERLVDDLAKQLQVSQLDPLAPECIVVQSQGMARYLTMRLADREGVWANPEFPFPQGILTRACDAVLGPAPLPAHGAEFSRASATWAIAQQLTVRRDEPVFAPLKNYLDEDPYGEKLLQVSQRLAALLDDYCVFRPELVLGWQAGRDPEDYQACLFRALVERFGEVHMAARARALEQTLVAGAQLDEITEQGAFPSRIFLFGVTSLPPLYLRLLSVLSQQMPVYMFQLSPCQEYWRDTSSVREQARRARKEGLTPEEMHLEQGPSLLASMGAVGKEFIAVLEDLGEPSQESIERYDEPGATCMLHLLQSDMLHLVERTPESRAPLVAGDRSVEVHVCHSPLRELEVLHDQLLQLFDGGELEPADVVVMAPDIERYAPLVSAVFGADSGRVAIPFKLADRAGAALDPVLQALSAVMALLNGRFELPLVMDLLANPAVRGHFAIDERDLPQLREWAQRSGMRWGFNAEHREQESQPRFEENTIGFGLSRMLLGYAMSSDGLRGFGGRLPYDDVVAGDVDLLGKFSEFVQTLGDLRSSMKKTLSPDGFVALLEKVIESTLDGNSAYSGDVQRVRSALGQYLEEAKSAGFAEAVSPGAQWKSLALRLGEVGHAQGYLTGGVTFCQALPMRSIPFPVVVMLGMDDTEFPRIDRPLSFDKRNHERRPGDRSQREEDRYLFLEALLSARHKFMVSYVGRSIHDNSERPPSVVVAELLEALEQSFCFEESAESQVCVQHALSARSPRYFSASASPSMASYAEGLLDGLRAKEQRTEARSFTQDLPFTDGGQGPLLTLTLKELESAVAAPITAFMNRRLGLYLQQDDEGLSSREPMALAGLERHAVGDRLLRLMESGASASAAEAALRDSGKLPLGGVGALAFRKLHIEVEGLRKCAQADELGSELPAQSFDISLGGIRVTGALTGLYEERLQRLQYARANGKGQVRLWVSHVILNYIESRRAGVRLPRVSRLIGRPAGGAGEPAVITFTELVDAEAVLLGLLRMAEQAMQEPLPFAWSPSWEFAKNLPKAKDADERAVLARKTLNGYFHAFNRAPDAHDLLAFPNADAVLRDGGVAFQHYAQQVYDPLLAHRVEGT